MKVLTKRLLSFLLAMLLVVGLMPMTAFASEIETGPPEEPTSTGPAETTAAELADPEAAEATGSPSVEETTAESTPAAVPIPEGTTASEPTELPDETDAEAQPGPEETSPPAESTTPAATTAPMETAAPAETTAPVATTVPVETTAPTETTAPAETNAPSDPSLMQPPEDPAEPEDGVATAAETDDGREILVRHWVDFNTSILVNGSARGQVEVIGVREKGLQESDFPDWDSFEAARRGTVAYCIEPGVHSAWEEDHTAATVTASNAWAALSYNQRVAVGLAMLYGAPNEMQGSGARDIIIYETVTAVIIHEICLGWREATPPYTRTNRTYFNALCLNGDLTVVESVYAYMNGTTIPAWRMENAYEELEQKLAMHNVYPSFTHRQYDRAPTHTMSLNADGSYSITLTDTSEGQAVVNGLYDFSSLSGNGLTVSVDQANGKVTIHADSFTDIPKSVLSGIRTGIPNPSTSSYVIWNSSSAEGQKTMQVSAGRYDPVPAYFKLRGAGGTVNLTKTTGDGKNLTGWRFAVYSDAACTQLIDGPYETDANGKIEGFAVPVGTCYVKELGHKDAAINKLYVCTSTNPQAVNAQVNGVYTVTFHNGLANGTGEIVKTTTTGTDLAGWQFGIYTDAACTKLYGTYTTDANGKIAASLPIGTYYVKETSAAPAGWTLDTSVKSFTIEAGKTSKVNFHNVQLGRITVRKYTNTGTDLGNWSFQVINSSGVVVDTVTTNNAGVGTSGYLPAGTYTVKEIGNFSTGHDSSYWIYDTGVKTLTVTGGGTATCSFTNTIQGKGKIIKTTNTGANLGGWQFQIFTDAACTNLYGTYTSNEQGEIVLTMNPGTYYVKEVAANKADWKQDAGTKTLTIQAGQTTSVTFNNKQLGRVSVQKYTNTGANLDGWVFQVKNSSGAVVATLTTDATGAAISGYLDPGNYTVVEAGNSNADHDPSYWICDTSSKSVTIAAGKTASCSFTNTIQGKGKIIKTTNTGANLAGWQFNIFTDVGCSDLFGTYTSSADGTILIDMPVGTYYVREVSANKADWSQDTQTKTLKITAGTTASVTFHNVQLGRIQVKKITNTGANLGNWTFQIKSGSTVVETVTTDANGIATSSYLAPGDYTVAETGNSGIGFDASYWNMETSTKTVTVTSGGAATVSFANTHQGKGKLVKSTNTGANLAGWQFGIYTDSACTQLVGSYTSAESGEILVNLNPGTYYVREFPTGDADWTLDTETKTLVISAGQTSSVTFNNVHKGRIQVNKNTNTGANLGSWTFQIKDSGGKVVETITTDEKGVATSSYLLPGSYTVTETGNSGSGYDASYWVCDTSGKAVTVTGGQTSTVTVSNIHQGKGKLVKSTNTGANLEGWQFSIYTDSACSALYGTFTTDEKGEILVNLNPGTYYVKEVIIADDYWKQDAAVKTLTITPGQTTTVTVTNIHRGRIIVQKATNTGSNLSGWVFEVYDGNGAVADTITTDSNGVAVSSYLLPGKYTVKETGSSEASHDASYWTYDSSIPEIMVLAGQDVPVQFTNTHYGKLKITKTIVALKNPNASVDSTAPMPPAVEGLPTDPLSGWQFELTDANGKKFGPYTTDEKGEILTENLLPGTYTVEEIIPEGSLYSCVSENPQTVEILVNTTAQVTFENRRRPATIHLYKWDGNGEKLAGATFLLEWSTDGKTWYPTFFSTDLIPGGCFTVGLQDGYFTVGDDGEIIFDGLHPELYYRVTETAAPNGYVLLADYAFVGKIEGDTMVKELHIINSLGYLLPRSGSNTMFFMAAGGALTAMFSLLLAFSLCFPRNTLIQTTTTTRKRSAKNMKKFNRFLSLLVVCCLMLGLATTAMAADVGNATIDDTKTASLSIYKYDLTSAMADGVWNNSYVSTAAPDKTNVQDKLSPYAIEGVEFTYLRVADIVHYQNNGTVLLLYGFAKDDPLLSAIGLTASKRYTPADELNAANYYFQSDAINRALNTALANDKTGVKNALENYIAGLGTAMPMTDANGYTTVSGLPLGLYLLVETKVKQDVTGTVNPFFVSLPMTSVNGTNATNGGQAWMYDVTLYPKNETGNPTLEKTLREALDDTGKNNGSAAITDGFAHTATGSSGDVIEIQIVSTLPAITSEATYLTRYTFADVLSAGMSYNKSDVVLEFFTDAACTNKVATWREDSGKFSVAYEGGADGAENMTIAMTADGLAEINAATTVFTAENAVESGYSRCTVRVTYAATVDSDNSLVLGDAGNPNSVELTWRRTSTGFVDELVDDCHLFSYGIDLLKTFTDEKGNYANVEFIVHNDTDNYFVKAELNQEEGIYYVVDHVTAEADATHFVPMTNNGKVIIHGLEDDVYTVTEVQTDNGYILLEKPIVVTIDQTAFGADCGIYGTDTSDLVQHLRVHKLLTATATIDGNDGRGALAAAMVADGESANAYAPLSVTNSRGVDLPQTGEVGAVWMTWIGSSFVVFGLLAAALLLTRRKEA